MEQKEMLKVTHIPTTQDDIQVGDVFHSSWGATMRMNTYWRVVRRTSKTVNYAPPEGGELVKLPMLPRKAYIRLAG